MPLQFYAMNIIHTAKELKPGSRKVCLAIGVFDGVHLGHQQIIRQTIADARQHDAMALVITFDRHPNTVVAPARVPPLIYSLPQKLRRDRIVRRGHVVADSFRRIIQPAAGRGFCSRPGARPRKDPKPLRRRGFCFRPPAQRQRPPAGKTRRRTGFTVHGLAAVSLDGQVVSSTRIREAIRSGNIDAASQMLGRPYAISGRVIEGDRIGRQLGFPTANLDVSGLMLPPNGRLCRPDKGGWEGPSRGLEHWFSSHGGVRHAPTPRRGAPA